MSQDSIKIYDGKFFTGEKYESQGVIQGEASVLEILESLGGLPLIKIDFQDLDDFLNGKLPFSNLGSHNLNSHDKRQLLNEISESLNYFIFQNGYRDISIFISLKQFELELTRKMNFFRWDDIYFRALYAKDNDGHIRMISYSVPERNEIGEIPENLLYLKKLEILDLPYNYITQIPENIKDLKSLKYLSLEGNFMGQVEKDWYGSICQLISLENLNLCLNDLPTIPDSIGNLINLKFLNLSNNELNSVPKSIKSLNNLHNFKLQI